MPSIAIDPCPERHARQAPHTAACPDAARPWVVLAALLGSSLAFDGTVVMVALPAMRAELGASFAEMQWVVDAYTLPLAGVMLPGGAARDAHQCVAGRRYDNLPCRGAYRDRAGILI